jgi:D-alanyl-D-alanine carboxypeptidase (penicillin-binding protein 5/6)
MPKRGRAGRTTRFARNLLFLLGCTTAGAQTPAAPAISAPSWLLLETRSDTELAAHNAGERRAPASLTKLMTAYVLFAELRAGRLRLDDRATVSAYAARLPGARMFLAPGENVAIKDLIQGMLVQSGNDATYTLVERASGNLPAFVARMNTEGQRLGLADTHFANATGLQNPQHYTTARDLARLALALRRDFPEYLGWFAQRDFTWAGIAQPNRNRLLARMPEVNGLKTGHTEAAGFCLAASATRDDMQLVAIVLGSDGEAARARDGQRLLEHGFRHFETRRVVAAGRELARAPVWFGAQSDVALGVNEDVWLTLPRGTFEQLEARTHYPQDLEAPVARATALGQLHLRLAERFQRDVPLVALDSVAEGSLAQRGADRVRRWLRGGEAQAGP